MLLTVVVAMTAGVVLGATFATADQPDPLFASLSGFNEGTATANRGAGDPDGWGAADITIDGTTLCYGLTVANISTPINAHIHVGRKSQNGSPVVQLTWPATGDPGATSGCVQISPALAHELSTHPHDYYVNVHTGDFPGGAVRGQLFVRQPS